jgi:hypothetical protein
MMGSPRVYFYCRNEEGNLQEDVIALAEGLRELGVPFWGSCDYWRESVDSVDHLIRHDSNVTPDDCDVVVVSYTWPYQIRMGTFDLIRRPLPDGLFHANRRYKTVYMDSHDGHRTVSWEAEFRSFDLILRSKLNRRAWYPENMKSWAAGLNNRILQATTEAPGFYARSKSLLVNFGASHPFPHGVRDLARSRFEPEIEKVLRIDRTKDDLSAEPVEPYEALMWRQTGKRYNRSYYERLRSSQAVAAFCGELIPPSPFRTPERYLVGGNKARFRRMFYEAVGRVDLRPRRAVQWDSFRFWEALAAGCAVFHLDLERYGVDLPVMPENWKHYIGIDLDRVGAAVGRILDEPECLERIAAAGREWALEHYSPRALASRLMGLASD